MRLDCKTLVLVGSLFIQLMASQGWAETSVDEVLRAAYIIRLFALETRLAILTSRRNLTSSELSSIRVLRAEQERLHRRLRELSVGCMQKRRYGTTHLAGHRRGRSNEYDRIVEQASRTHALPAALVKAVVKAESDFDPYAVSKAGACGLMQLMPETARDLGILDPFDPRENIFGGTRLLRRHIDEFGSVKKALIAYNAGAGVVRKGLRIPRETREYVKRVIDYYHTYKK